MASSRDVADLRGRRLRSACAIGLAPGLLEHFELSLDGGIGGYLFREGRILRELPTLVPDRRLLDSLVRATGTGPLQRWLADSTALNAAAEAWQGA